MNFEALLSSAVIAAFFSGFVSYIISRKQVNLQYITGERKEWREKIRDIATKLDGASYKKTVHLLTKLKIRINAFGNNGVFISYSKDAHIWELINDIEKEEISKSILRLKQKQMIEYLSLLLKSDWEHSKKEVRGNACTTISFFLIVALNIYFFLSIFNLHVDNIDLFNLISVSIAFLIMMAFLCFVSVFGLKDVCNYLLSGVITIKPQKYKISLLYVCYITWIVSIVICMGVYVYFVKRFLELVPCGENDSMIILISGTIYASVLSLVSWAQVPNFHEIYHYNSSVNKVRGKYYELQSTILENGNVSSKI